MTMLDDDTRRERVSGTWRLPRSRGLAAGIALIVLGCWAGLSPFVGPYFGYAYTPASPWAFTWGRLWLEILPAAAAIAGGILLTSAANRLAHHAGGWLAVAAGGWLLIGPPLSQIWAGGATGAGHPTGNGLSQAVEQIGFFTGLGGVITLVAALALGRASVRSVRDVRAAEKRRAARHADHDTEHANDTTETRNAAQTGATADAEPAETGAGARKAPRRETVPGDGDQPAPTPSRTAGQTPASEAPAGQTSAGGAYEVSRQDAHEKDPQRGDSAEARRTTMAKDPNTTIDKLAGKAKKATGRLSGNDRLRGEGDREQRGAELKDKASQARDKATGAVRRRRHATRDDGHDQSTGAGQRAVQQDAGASESGHTFREAGQKAGEALDAARDAFREK
jgi:uncharacterized protein YjbJ (UPF0337 family)